MRRSWVGFAFITVITATAVAVAVGQFLAPPPRAPRVEVDDQLHLGECESGAVVTGRIRVTNGGEGDLVLNDFGTTCSCAAMMIEEEGRRVLAESVRIPRGRSTELLANVAAAGRVGTAQQVFVLFRTNDPEFPRVQVELVIDRIRGGLAAKPTAVSFGESAEGAESRRRVLLYSNGVHGRAVAKVISSNPERFTAALVPPAADERDDEFAGRLVGVVEVVARGDRPTPLDGHVELVLAGEERATDRLQVTGAVLPAVAARPDVVVLPRSANGVKAFDATVVISHRDGRAFRAACGDPPAGLSVRVAPVGGQADRCEVLISAHPGAAPGRSVVRVAVETPGGARRVVEIPVTVVEAP